MSLTGHVEDLGVAEILYVVGISRRSGELMLESGSRDIRVLFREGKVVGVHHARSREALHELLERAGVAEEPRLSELTAMAHEKGRTVVEVLEQEGLLRRGQLERPLEAEIERFLLSILDLADGTFRFRLLADVSSVVGEYGGVLLEHGIEPARLSGVSERHRQVGLGNLRLALPRGSGRRADLLVSEEEISLPVRGRETGKTAGVAAALPRERRPLVVVALDVEAWRKSVVGALEAAGLEARVADAHGAAMGALQRACSEGRGRALIAQASRVESPALELLAWTRTVDRGAAVVVVLDDGAPPERRGAVQDRAAGLGALHVVVLPAAPGSATERGAIAEDLALRIRQATQPPAPGGAPPPTALPADASDWGGLDEDDPRERRAAWIHPALPTAATAGLPPGEASDIAAALLQSLGRHAPRAAVVIGTRDGVRPFGAFSAAESDPARSALLAALVLPQGSADFISRSVREARRFTGGTAGVAADRELWTRLGRPRHVVVAPLVVAGTSYGAVYADDGGSGRAPDLAALTGLLGAVGEPFERALRASQRRAEAARLRIRS